MGKLFLTTRFSTARVFLFRSNLVYAPSEQILKPSNGSIRKLPAVVQHPAAGYVAFQRRARGSVNETAQRTQAIIDPRKVIDNCLNPDHDDGRRRQGGPREEGQTEELTVGLNHDGTNEVMEAVRSVLHDLWIHPLRCRQRQSLALRLRVRTHCRLGYCSLCGLVDHLRHEQIRRERRTKARRVATEVSLQARAISKRE